MFGYKIFYGINNIIVLFENLKHTLYIIILSLDIIKKT